MMRNNLINIIIAVLMLIPSITSAQVKVSKMDQDFKPDRGGFVYALPRTLVRIDVVIEKKELLAGPLRNYAEEYLGINNYINSNSSEYLIRDIRISSLAEADPEQYYFVALEQKTSRETWQNMLNLNGKGIITSINALDDNEQLTNVSVNKNTSPQEIMDIFSKYADLNKYEKVDTIVRKVNIDTMTITDYTFHTTLTDKPLKVRAEEAARMIKSIRESRFNLLTGYQEVNYTEGAIRFMNDELNRLEEEYLRLFTGVTVGSTLTYTFTYLPTEDNINNSQPVFRLSKSTGIVEGNAGEAVNIRITTSGNTSGIVSAPQGAGIFYRLPEEAEVKLFYGNNLIAQSRMPISQFGKIASLPVSASDVNFDENTGGLRSVKLQAE